jgi:isopenicillin N synthase-like dioxygenase
MNTAVVSSSVRSDDFGTIPVIDISGYFTGQRDRKRAIAAEIDAACRSIGFLVISGHNVSDELLQRMDRATRSFFAEPLEDKRQYKTKDPAIYRGFYEIGSNAVAYSLDDQEAAPDYCERFSINKVGFDASDPYYASEKGQQIFAPNIWPNGIAGFEATWAEYYAVMEQLAQALMRLFALGLNLDEFWFDDKIDKHMTNLTANWYPDQRDPVKPGQLRAGAHTDYGSLTILKTENKPGGLEVQTRQGNWAPVPIIPGTFIVNIGDLMAQWTNDRWVSTMHRVANPPRDMTTGTERLSLVFFHQPNYDALVECLPSCLEGGAAKYAPVTSGDHLMMKLTKMQQV